MIKIHLNIWLGRPEYCNFLAPPACKLTLPIKGPSLLRITLPSPDLKPEYPLQCGHTSAATAAKNLLSGEIIDIHTFWSLINNELCTSTFPNSNWGKCWQLSEILLFELSLIHFIDNILKLRSVDKYFGQIISPLPNLFVCLFTCWSGV